MLFKNYLFSVALTEVGVPKGGYTLPLVAKKQTKKKHNKTKQKNTRIYGLYV